MINIYKSGGHYKTSNGAPFSCKTINVADKAKHIIDGWVASIGLIDDIEDAVFEEIKEVKPKSTKTKEVAKHDP